MPDAAPDDGPERAIHITDIEAAINWWRERSPSPDGVSLSPEVRALAEVYGLLVWALTRRWPIIRAGWLTLLAVGLFLHRTEGVLALLVLGQFRQAWLELTERRCPTDGAFSQEVN